MSFCDVKNDVYNKVAIFRRGVEIRTGQVRCGVIRRSSASPRPPCDGIPSASVWPSPIHTPGPTRPYPSDRPPPDAYMKPVDAPSAWSSLSDLDKKESDGRDPPQGVAPHAHRGVVGAHDDQTSR